MRKAQPSYASTAIGCAGLIALAGALTFVTYDLLAPTLPELRMGFAIASAIFFALGLSSFGSSRLPHFPGAPVTSTRPR